MMVPLRRHVRRAAASAAVVLVTLALVTPPAQATSVVRTPQTPCADA
ncbi:MAG: hypothetical protein HOY71_16710 [Nonomuraea sp.]|nr:hypothetical protein [Nonomuraea sp.]